MVVRASPTLVLIVMTARPGGQTGDICQGGPPLASIVEIGEPIGSRTLIDGGTWPGRDARLIPEP
jgi:hypothetical protein